MNQKTAATNSSNKSKPTGENEFTGQVLEFFNSENRLTEIANQIETIQAERKGLSEAINELLGEAESLGVPKKAFRLAIQLRDEKYLERFDKGLIRARAAIGIPMQMEFDFPKKGEGNDDNIRN